MANDVIITPATGLVEFKDNTVLKGSIYESAGDIVINPVTGSVVLGDGTPANIIAGGVGVPVNITLQGGGNLSSNTNTLGIGVNGDTVNFTVAGVTYNWPTTLMRTSDYTATDILTRLKTVDGLGSGLDADLLDGYSVGTVGATIPLLNTANTWSATQTIPTLAGNTQITGGLTVSGSVASGAGDMGGYRGAGTNLVLKGDSVGRSGIFFESEKDGVAINHASDYGFIQFHPYGLDGSSGESNRLVIGVANDLDDFIVLQAPGPNGLKFSFLNATSGSTMPLYTVWHEGNDGTGSGLDADLLDGLNSTAFAQLSGATFTGAISGTSLTLSGDLTVNGTTTTINSTTVTVDDKNLELGSVATPTDATADGGGITLKGATDKTFNWVSATGYWTSNQSISAPRLISTVAQGTAPLIVTSNTLVANLNANLLDGAARDSSWATVSGNNIPVRHPSGYLYANYFNTPADKTTGVPSHIAIQTNSDDYIRWNTFAQFRTNLGIIDPVTLAASLRANRNISGGGTITVDASSNIFWSQRFIVISNSRGTTFATDGYFSITCPVSGTITGVGGAGNQTASAAGIPLPDWHALYYILPIGSTETSVAANFRIASYTGNIDIPHNWVLICVKNPENGYFHFPNGINLKVGQNSTNIYPNGGTFTGTASSVTNAITFNTAGAGDASGTTYNGSAARTISYNTVGAPAYAQVAGSNFNFNNVFPATTTLNRVVWNSGDGNMLNSPNGNSTGVLLASQGSHGLWNAQMFFEQGSAGSMFIRGSDDASGTRAWGAWKRLITAADTGTVSTTMLATVNSNVGSFGSASSIPVITVNAKGLITAVSTSAVSIPSGSISVTGGDLTLSGTTGTAITNATLATVNSNTGSFGSATSVPVITVNAKGLVTAVSTATVTSLPSQTGNTGKFLTTDGTTASWTSTTAAAGGGIQVNNSTISTTYTIPAGSNGFSVGPITVANGTAITVSSGQRWVIL